MQAREDAETFLSGFLPRQKALYETENQNRTLSLQEPLWRREDPCWFTGFSLSFVIGQSYYFGFGVYDTYLKSACIALFPKRSIKFACRLIFLVSRICPESNFVALTVEVLEF